MSVLHTIAKIRNPVLDEVMYLITQCGDEIVFLVVALFIFWCIDKKKGYYCLMVGFWGLEINQLLKMVFRIPRPWVLEPGFSIVEKARAGAGGYSFPSGHTQIATGLFGAIAKSTKEKKLRISCVIIILLVAFSRMYLGVHTPMDVGASLVIASILVYLMYIVFYPETEGKGERDRMQVLILCTLILSVLTILYMVKIDSRMVDENNLSEALKVSFTSFGAFAGLIITWYADENYLQFETEAAMKIQVIKLAAGFVIVLILKAGLKIFFGGIPMPSYIADMIRYFILVLFIGIVWPMVFMYANNKMK